MTTLTTTFADDLQLQDGDELDLHAVAKGGTLVVTRIMHHEPQKSGVPAAKPPSFSQRWRGKFSLVDDPFDIRIMRMNAKHVK